MLDRDDPDGAGSSRNDADISSQGARLLGSNLAGRNSEAAALNRARSNIGCVAELLRDLYTRLGPKVEYRFETSNTLGSAFANERWSVQSLTLVEELSATFEIKIKVATEDCDADPTSLVGADARLSWERAPLARSICGIIRQVEQGSITDELAAYELIVVPAFQLLDQQTVSRVFQDMTVPEIVGEVLTAGLQAYGRTFDASLLTGRYPKREYCVQYQESDHDFCCRLLEEEGIAFCFDTNQRPELLVLIDRTQPDDVRKFPKLETEERLGVPIAIEAGSGVESIRAFVQRTAVSPTRVLVQDWNWSRGRGEVHCDGDADERGRVREQYDHSHEVTIHSYGSQCYEASDVRQQALLLRARQVRAGVRCSGLGFVTQMRPGTRLEITGHSNSDLDGEYLITKVSHANRAPAEMEEDHLAAQLNYHNEFECLPVAAPYVPPRRHSKPRIHGMQTAMVCGPEDQRVHTDEWGRIKLWFPWDLKAEGAGDRFIDRHTCWVRVQQAFAGTGWGSTFIPHVGMEAVVSFLNGDPDRPLVTGVVYGGMNTLPYPMPDRNPVSTIKTVGNNELRFDDTAGNEEVFVHAQRNLNERVEHSHSTNVGASQSNTVGGGQTESVGGNQTLTVSRDRNKTVKGKETNTIVGDRTSTIEAGNESLTVIFGDRTVNVANGNNTTLVQSKHEVVVTGREVRDVKGEGRKTSIVALDELAVDGNRKTVVTGNHESKTDGRLVVTQGKTTLTLADDQVTLEAGDDIGLTNSGGHINVLAAGKVELQARDELKLVCGQASIVLKSDGQIEIVGATKINLTSESSIGELSPSGIKWSAPDIKIESAGPLSATGNPCKVF